MTEICAFCRESQDYGASMQLAENVEKVKNLMETTEFGEYLLESTLICKDCNNLACDFFEFKSAFMEKEDELLNHKTTKEKVDLCEILVTIGKLERSEDIEIFKICRICFMNTKADDYEEIVYSESELAKMISMCLPEFDFFLTTKTFICPECNGKLLKYHHFILSCIEARNQIKTNSQSDAVLWLNYEPQNKKAKVDETNPLNVEESSVAPIGFQKRRRGRPRKLKLSTPRGIPTQRTTERKEYNTIEEIEEKLNETNIENCDLSFECQICPALYDTFKALLEHIKFHEQEKQFTCWKCGACVSTLGALRTHFSSHGFGIFKIAEEKPEEEVCQIERPKQVETVSKEERKESWIVLLPSEENKDDHYIECQLCLEKWQTFWLFQKHIKEHIQIREFHCPKCLFDCSVINEIQMHMQAEHGIPKLYRIRKCNPAERNDQSSAIKKTLPVIENVETVTKTFNCISPSRNFNSTIDFENYTYQPERPYCCGHCSGVFDSLDELDEHDCVLAPRKTPKEDLESENEGPLVNTNFTSHDENAIQQHLGADYECSFCFSSFTTVKALDDHHCTDNVGTPPSPTINENIICSKCLAKFGSYRDLSSHVCLKSAANDIIVNNKSGSEHLEFNQGDQFLCISCGSICNTYLDLSIHECSFKETSNAPNPNIVTKRDGFVCLDCAARFDTFCDMENHDCHRSSLTNNIESFIKKEPHYDHFSESIKQDAENSSCYIENKGNIEKDIPSEKFNEQNIPPNDKPDTKEVITKIANGFGVKIVETVGPNIKMTFNCISCDYIATNKKDLLIHFNYCEQIKKCHCCTYRTNLAQKLEIHYYCAHNTIMYACSRCRFITSMEENFESHMYEHKDKGDIFWDQKITAEETETAIAINKVDWKFNTKANESNEPVKEEEECADETSETVIINFPTTQDTDMKDYSIKSDKSVISSDLDEENDAEVTHPIMLIDVDPNSQHNSENFYVEDDHSTCQNEFSVPDRIIEDPLPVTVKSTALDSNNFEQPNNSSSGLTNTLEIADDLDLPQIVNVESLSMLAIEDNKPISNKEEVIDVDSDSDNEFIESVDDRIANSSTIVENITVVDSHMASQLISQGVPVVNESNLSQMNIHGLSISPQTEPLNPTSTDANQDNLKLVTKKIMVKLSIPNTIDDFSESQESVLISDDENQDLDNNSGQLPTGIASPSFTDTSPSASSVEPTGKIKTKRNRKKLDKSNRKANTVKNVVKNNCIVISDDEVDKQQESTDQPTHEHQTKLMDNDCVVMGELEVRISKNLMPPAEEATFKKPPNAYRLFYDKVRTQIKKKYPRITGSEQRTIILKSWKSMPDEQKWPFVEEARIHRLLFKREHPELFDQSGRQKKPQQIPVRQMSCTVTNRIDQSGDTIEEIILD